MLARVLSTDTGNILISSFGNSQEDFDFTIMIDGYYSGSENDECNKYSLIYIADLSDAED